MRHFPKDLRYTLGNKIDLLFIETIEAIFQAANLIAAEKLPMLRKASSKLDLLKFFLQIAWEIKAIDNKKYQLLSEPLVKIGKMFGGWIRQLQAKPNPAYKNGAGK